MTDAQKKSRARFKAAVSEAAKLRKKNPRLSQADAVKQAWAILYGKERAGKKIAGPKKPAKKTAKKTATKAGERHTDTKSHNVNIRVMSGVKSDIKKRLKQSGKRLKHGYQIVPGDVRKISGMNETDAAKKDTVIEAVKELAFWENIQKNMNKKLKTPGTTAIQRSQYRASIKDAKMFIGIYKKVLQNFTKAIK